MMDFRITVYAELKNPRLAGALSSVSAPPGIILEISDITDGSVCEFPDDHISMVITDDLNRADKLARLPAARERRLRVIFAGRATFIETFDDIWETTIRGEFAERFRRTLKRCSAELNERFYKDLLLTTIDTVPDMLWYKRLDGIHMLVNTAFTGIVHKERDDIIGKDHFYIWDAPRPAEGNEFACAESEETAIRTGKTYICDEPVKTREGMKQLTTYKTPVYDMFGNVFGTVGVGHDVTNFSNLGIELSILVENLPFPMIIFTADMKVVRMNEEFMKIAELDRSHIDSFDYLRWEKEKLIPTSEKTVDEKKHLTSQEFTVFYAGEEHSVMIRLQEIHDFFDNISGYFLIMNDMTYQRAYEQSLIRAANIDMLTGMYNRRYFYTYLSENSNKPMTLFYMDLDRFKYVNDRYGHARGDDVLVKTATVIKTLFPEAVSARLGGDEFALVIEGTLTKEEIEENIKSLENTIQTLFITDGLPVTMSVGTAAHDGTNVNVDQFMHLGDSMMYEVKKLKQRR